MNNLICLLKKPDINLNTVDKYGCTSLHFAIFKKKYLQHYGIYFCDYRDCSCHCYLLYICKDSTMQMHIP